MKALVYSELTASELPNRLEFRVDREFGWGLVFAYPALCFGLIVLCSVAAFTQEYPSDWSIGIGIGAAINLVAIPIMIAIARKSRTTTLSVTSQLFVAVGRGVGSSHWRSSEVTTPVSEVSWVGYVPGYAPGLYLSRSLLDSKCILPGLNREQTNSVTEAIVRRFPDLRSKMRPES